MFPQTMPRSEQRPDNLPPDLAHTLEEHLLAGFPPDLALDLVLNELVVRAAESTRSSGAALALAREEQMVCRAATGQLAPGLGVPLNTHDGLSGACLQTRKPQLSADTELDPRVDHAAARRLGIRSILIVPIFRLREEEAHASDEQSTSTENEAEMMGILEVFSSSPDGFSQADQTALQEFAAQCARIRLVATELSWHKPAADYSDDFMPPPLPQVDFMPLEGEAGPVEAWRGPMLPPDITWPSSEMPIEAGSISGASTLDLTMNEPAVLKENRAAGDMPFVAVAARSRYEMWSVLVGGLAIAAIIGVSFLMGSRIGWIRAATARAWGKKPAATYTAVARSCAKSDDPNCVADDATAGRAIAAEPIPPVNRAAEKPAEKTKQKTAAAAPTPAPDELVVYEKGKVVFRMKPAPARSDSMKSGGSRQPADSVVAKAAAPNSAKNHDGVVEASSTTKIAPSQSVWLAPQEADGRILSRTEPQFPAEAKAAHVSGNVVLQVQVAEDGSVSGIRVLSGDPMLANAAADAVRNWRYQPYRQHNHPLQFQTDVTLSFTLPN